jgi:hypothetical protein
MGLGEILGAVAAPVTALGTLAGGIGSLGGAFLGYQGQKDTNKQNLAIAREQMAFQERMSNTAYQRAMQDMKDSGLNPILAYSQGGASTPIGASAQMMNPYQSASNVGQQVAGTIMDVGKKQAEIDNLNSELLNHQEFRNLSQEQQNNVKWMTRKVEQEISNLSSQGLSIDYDNIVKSIVTKFKQDNPTLTLMQAFGLDGRSLTGMIGDVLKLGIGKGTMKKRTDVYHHNE